MGFEINGNTTCSHIHDDCASTTAVIVDDDIDDDENDNDNNVCNSTINGAVVDRFDTRLRMEAIPLRALRPKTRELIASHLNRCKILPSENSLLRDWRGLFDLTHLPRLQYAAIETHSNPTVELLLRWQQVSPMACVGELEQHMLDIDRLDCLDDCRESFGENELIHTI